MKLITLVTLTVFVALATAGPETITEISGKIAGCFDQETGTFVDGAYDILIDAHTMIADADLSEENEVFALESMNSMVTYNLACLEAIDGNKEQSLAWLEESINSGYNDAEWMPQDEDLSSLQSEPKFQELLEIVANNHVESNCATCDHNSNCN